MACGQECGARIPVTGMLRAAPMCSFPAVAVQAALQCAGNRRVELQQVGPTPGEILWDLDAASTAR